MDAIIWNVRSVNTMQAFERLITMHRQHHSEFIGILEPMQQSSKMERYKSIIGLAQAVVNVSNKIWAFIVEVFEVTILYNMVQQLTLKLFHIETHGDFNMIWDEEEKFGGLPVSLIEVDDFRHCINTCNLTDLGFKGSIFTWWNGRSEDDCIFKRLDRCLGNMELQQTFPGFEITHLSKIGSDHCPMLLKCDIETPPIKKSFKFLNFWTKNDTFKDVVKENWNADFSANPFVLFNHKLKKLKKVFSTWSRSTFGDIFQKIASLEEVVLVHERQFEAYPTQQNRERLQKVQAEMIRFLAIEEEFWKQKSGIAWFKDGDRNTKFFHAQVKGRRKRLQLNRIKDNMGNWIEEDEHIAEEAVRFYQDQFTETLRKNENTKLTAVPTREEVKRAVYGLNGDSAAGPDGYTGAFYHTCWDIVGEDIYAMVLAFFNGQQLPKCVTHTNLVLLPKKKEVSTFSDLRPISLSNFINKIFSRVIHERLVDLLPHLISEEQAGFVKGRSIVENVLLTQEIITDIRMRTKAGPNVVIKLDMTKAYDRLSWLFLTKMLRKLGFCERFIGMVFDLVGNNWYSVLVNGQAHGFFKSTRGVKQGDPLSPTLFILAAEALSRGLNSLHQNLYFCGFGLPKWSLKINHLAYADDTIIFSSSDATSLRLVMEVLHAYESASGQLVNKSKSPIYMHHLSDMEVVRKVERVSGLERKTSFNWRKSIIDSKCPSIIANTPAFFWSSAVGGTSRHWASWTNLCLPYEEGGIGFRSLHDVSKALFSKLWGNFRTKPSLWSSFVSQKYCKKHNANFGVDESIQNVFEVVQNGAWDIDKLLEVLPKDLAMHIVEKISPPVQANTLDSPYWMLEPKGNFTVKSAWEYLRRRADPKEAYKKIWVKGIPFKIGFFMWKVWRAKLPLDDFMKRLGYLMPSRCWCCVEPKEETLTHLFFTSNTAKIVWKYFLGRAGIAIEGLTMHQAITKCWTAQVLPRIKPVMQALPSCIVWELWKRRNSLKYGEVVSVSRVIHQASTTLQSLVKLRKPGLRVPHRWHLLLSTLENYTSRLRFDKVTWEFPIEGWLKVNTDGASRGNPGRSSIGFCIRDDMGDVRYAVGKEISEGSNNEAEAVAILEALRFCKSQQYSKIWLQTDSLVLKNVIEGTWDPPWTIVEYVEEIRQLKGEFSIKVSHIFREGNKLVDHLANSAFDAGGIEGFGFWDLDSHGRRLVNGDKL
ncbi:PREDICTED: uncharacterized protein LOC109227594 [Nicotiana attenuata]|uniref:uncharacterized protein LOC109227594 n=1 Tax=Nicotiana attenuata TaxID=49451 RepID=UPI0009058775|nr:PREDICTED: uncharacterized protein LOC109227594 [Nicotiana attenuata]